ncbi:hypothetical protein DFP72DRAFT_909930 [Ephemerocybe angulata]|uniref:Uncharacterized protein n=1 Tax=Ephemerocybe angulata TaxID=980116 RepID=A0A8H6HNW4_9AGAR|nr:hypothetical protein DFP72DRAFT_909930 [Tulosesus angulatus]
MFVDGSEAWPPARSPCLHRCPPPTGTFERLSLRNQRPMLVTSLSADLNIARSLSYIPTAVPPVVVVQSRFERTLDTLGRGMQHSSRKKCSPQNNPHLTIAAIREQTSLPPFNFVFLRPLTGLQLSRISPHASIAMTLVDQKLMLMQWWRRGRTDTVSTTGA